MEKKKKVKREKKKGKKLFIIDWINKLFGRREEKKKDVKELDESLAKKIFLKKLKLIGSGLNEKNKKEEYSKFMAVLYEYLKVKFNLNSGITFREFRTGVNKNKKPDRLMKFFDEVIYWKYSGDEIKTKEFRRLIKEARYIALKIKQKEYENGNKKKQ